MAIGNKIEKRGHIVGFREEIARAAATPSDDEFFTWFDTAKDKDAAFVRGCWDFMIHVAQPAARYLATPEDKVALEIGYGGGRILAAASRSFKTVIGVDIHGYKDKVETELKSRGIDNCRLLHTDGRSIPLGAASCDVVFSFIVLQHVEKYAIFENYFRETHRVLKPNGIAVLYFGRKFFFSADRRSKILYTIDRFAEHLLLRKGYEEIPAKVNCTNLMVSLPHARSLARHIGFDVLSELVSRKKVPDGTDKFGVQNGLVIRKR